MAHKSLQVGDMADEDIKTFYKKLERVVTFSGCFCDSSSEEIKFFEKVRKEGHS